MEKIYVWKIVKLNSRKKHHASIVYQSDLSLKPLRRPYKFSSFFFLEINCSGVSDMLNLNKLFFPFVFRVYGLVMDFSFYKKASLATGREIN